MSSTETTSLGAVATPAASVWNEDWLAVAIGLLVFVLSLAGLAGTDLLGWVVATSVWTDPGTALAPSPRAMRRSAAPARSW